MLDENNVERGLATHQCIACGATRCWEPFRICVLCIDQGVDLVRELSVYYARFRQERITEAFKHTGKATLYIIHIYVPDGINGWVFQSKSPRKYSLDEAKQALKHEWDLQRNPTISAFRYKVVVVDAEPIQNLRDFFP